MGILLGMLGDPHDKFKVIHIAGTNGKGSVSLKTTKGLAEAGAKVGLFTSPHINTFRERVQIFHKGQTSMISKQNVIIHVNKLFSVVEENRESIESAGGDVEAIRFFDLITIMAFMEFAEQKCEWVVLECGLGGRLDATNVIKPPVCVGITSIGLDHTEVLGESLPEIAVEKSKIIKSGIKGCVLGPTCHSDENIFRAFNSQLGETNSSDILVKVHANEKSINEINSEIARNLLKFAVGDLPDSIPELLTQTRQPCRFQPVSPLSEEGTQTIILDVCHNP